MFVLGTGNVELKWYIKWICIYIIWTVAGVTEAIYCNKIIMHLSGLTTFIKYLYLHDFLVRISPHSSEKIGAIRTYIVLDRFQSNVMLYCVVLCYMSSITLLIISTINICIIYIQQTHLLGPFN